MSVEQHAEAAANWIGETPTSTLGTIEHIIAKHMQSAIDEATAPLRARIAVLEGLGPLIEEYGSDCASAESWRDSDWKNPAIRAREDRDATLVKITAILKGGAP